MIRDKYPKLKIAGYYSPPLGFEKDAEQLEIANERIRNSGADILIVFLGCPKQEKFIANKIEISDPDLHYDGRMCGFYCLECKKGAQMDAGQGNGMVLPFSAGTAENV